MRKRITAVKVAQSGDTSSLLVSNGPVKPAIARYNCEFGTHKVRIPKNVGRETYNDFLLWLKCLHPKNWEKVLAESSEAMDKAFNRSKRRIIGQNSRTIRKGYTVTVVR